MIKNDFEGFSTLVRGYFNVFGPHSGTGFFYYESNYQTGDNIINNWNDFVNNKIWLITARHNIYPPPPQQQHSSQPSESYEEYLPYEFRIYLKSNRTPKWEEIILSDDDLLKNGRIHNDIDVDIAAIEITDILKDKLKERDNYIDYYAFHQSQFPTSFKADESRIVIVGFPESNNSFFSPLATKPEIRSGTIKSIWGSTLDGLPIFEVNVMAEMGFSGSPAIYASKSSKLNSKITGRLNDNNNHVSFLGVYVGTSSENKTTVVFYGNMVEEVINHGLPFFTARYRYVDRN